MRLNKAIAELGICSRRKADELIANGKVFVNEKKITEMGTQVDQTNDTITVKGYSKQTQKKEDFIYIVLNKPIDYISSTTNAQGKSVMELLTKDNYLGKHKHELHARVYPVGRLDKDSEGLILLTNDGDLANKLTHPKHQHEKEYEVTIDTPLSKDAKKVLEKGMIIENEFAQGVQIGKEIKIGRKHVVNLILKEGKNRQIRRMLGRLGYNVQNLKRIRIANTKLKTLPVGKWLFIQKEHII
jgi:pseudouridine synthase